MPVHVSSLNKKFKHAWKNSGARMCAPYVTYKFHMHHKRIEYVTDAFSASLRDAVYATCTFWCTLHARFDFLRPWVGRLRNASVSAPSIRQSRVKHICNAPLNVHVAYQKNVFWHFKCLSTIIALQTQCHKYWYKRLILFVLRFYGPVNPMGSCRARSVYLTTRLLGRLSPQSG